MLTACTLYLPQEFIFVSSAVCSRRSLSPPQWWDRMWGEYSVRSWAVLPILPSTVSHWRILEVNARILTSLTLQIWWTAWKKGNMILVQPLMAMGFVWRYLLHNQLHALTCMRMFQQRWYKTPICVCGPYRTATWSLVNTASLSIRPTLLLSSLTTSSASHISSKQGWEASLAACPRVQR